MSVIGGYELRVVDVRFTVRACVSQRGSVRTSSAHSRPASGTSNNALFRLRQAWAELGTEQFRILAGQANSLWNEGVFETIIDATNLNQSFIRQAQVRATARLAPGLTGMVSLEAPETQYTSVAGVFNPGASLDGGASPAFNTAPDLLGRLTYRNDGLVADMRGMVRRLSVRTGK